MSDTDLIDRLAGIPEGSALAALRAERADIARHTEGAYRALLEPDEPGLLSLAERAFVARDVAFHHEDVALAAHYGALLGARGGEPAGERAAAIATHVAMTSRRPRDATPADIARLRQAGLGESEIVTLSQIVAYVSYQTRLLAGLALMAGGGRRESPPPAPPIPPAPFTIDPVDWSPWIAPVDIATATPAQKASLSETPSNTKVSAYSLVLAHDPAALGERTPLFNKIMYAPRGLPRAERELATLVESVGNGCVYCASVHARRFIELAKAPEVVSRIYAGEDPGLDPRRASLVAFADALGRTPVVASGDQLAALRGAGLSDLEVLDLIHAVAMFAWANRLMLTLGEPAAPF